MIPGHYKSRLCKGAPFSPILVYRPCPLELEPETFQWIDRCYHLVLVVAGEEKPWPVEINVVRPEPGERWAPAYERWPNLNPISAAEYHWRIADQAWARVYAPDAPEASPRMPVDLATLPALF